MLEKELKTILLSTCEKHNLKGNKVAYELNLSTCSDFIKIASDIICSVFDGCTALGVFECDIRNKERGYIEKAKRYISEKHPSWQCCNFKYIKKYRFSKGGRQYFFIKSDKADSAFAEYDILNGLYTVGYMKKHFTNADDIILTAYDFADSDELGNEAISVYADIYTLKLQFTLNPMQYPVDLLLKRLEDTIKVYGKALETEI